MREAPAGWLLGVAGISPRAAVVAMSALLVPPALAWMAFSRRTARDRPAPGDG